MTSARFLIAKYVPDLRRMEPRNIGVIVWCNGAVACKFAGESFHGKCSVQPPKRLRVGSHTAFRQWIKYWRGLAQEDSLKAPDGTFVDRDSELFVDLLKTKSREQYFLAEGGFFASHVSAHDVDDVAGELFELLVDPPHEITKRATSHREALRQLSRGAKEVIESTGFSRRRDFHKETLLPCKVGTGLQSLPFDFMLGYTKPKLIMMKVPLEQPTLVHSAAFRFNAVQTGKGLHPDRCVSMVYMSETSERTDSVNQSLDLMQSLGSVVNVANPIQAADRLLSLVT